MSTDGTFVKELERVIINGETQTVTIDGVTYTNKKLNDIRAPEPEADPININTLTGLVEYIKADFDAGVTDAMVHVVSHDHVELFSAMSGRFFQRNVFAVAKFSGLLDQATPFRFGQHLDAESFVVALQCLFEPSADLKKVLAVVGNLREESVKTTADDGVTQTVTAKAGVVLSSTVEVPNPVTLRPYRTFREIDQPESRFVLRLRGGGQGSVATCALFEADGGAWKLEAIQRIAVYLNANLKDVPVIA